jgi:RTX calcium-binding nonapeptide repeat (4 copies)
VKRYSAFFFVLVSLALAPLASAAPLECPAAYNTSDCIDNSSPNPGSFFCSLTFHGAWGTTWWTYDCQFVNGPAALDLTMVRGYFDGDTISTWGTNPYGEKFCCTTDATVPDIVTVLGTWSADSLKFQHTAAVGPLTHYNLYNTEDSAFHTRVNAKDEDDYILGSDDSNFYEFLEGGAGSDEIRSDDGSDAIFGCLYTGSAAECPLDTDVDDLYGGPDDDWIECYTACTVSGGYGVDKITGGLEADTINAGPGNDLVCGGDGADTIFGGRDNDDIVGGPGTDTVSGGGGTDSCNAENHSGCEMASNGCSIP